MSSDRPDGLLDRIATTLAVGVAVAEPGDTGNGQPVLLMLIVAVLLLAWTPATGALAAACCALVFWTVLCHLATTPKGTLS